MNSIKKLLIFIIIIITMFAIFIVNGMVENIFVNDKIREFTERGMFVLQEGNISYYKVKKAHDYEDTTRHIVDTYNDQKPGAKADIFVTSRNPIYSSVTLGYLSRLTWIGHSGLVIDDEGKETIEITGNMTSEENVVQLWDNTWVYEDSPGIKTPQIALLRLKNTTEEQRNKIASYANSKIGYKYNYTFLFNRNKSFYCSDLISRSVSAAGINVNYDYLATTGSDMLVSDETYIIYYKETTVENNVQKHKIYYLEG